MRILGVDYGEKRIGVAVSDEEGKLAFPKMVLPNNSELAASLSDMAREAGTSHIVIGESRDFKGEANPVMKGIRQLKQNLESLGFTVSLEPEYMTSAQAERLQDRNEELDASAAAVILQSYLDRHRV